MYPHGQDTRVRPRCTLPMVGTAYIDKCTEAQNPFAGPLLLLLLRSSGDCCECTCINGPDYSCDTGFYCKDPASDCVDPLAAEYPNCTGYLSEMGNGHCNQENNNDLCAYDLGKIILWCTSYSLRYHSFDSSKYRDVFLECLIKTDKSIHARMSNGLSFPTISPTQIAVGTVRYRNAMSDIAIADATVDRQGIAANAPVSMAPNTTAVPEASYAWTQTRTAWTKDSWIILIAADQMTTISSSP